jgi:hypothetical protein
MANALQNQQARAQYEQCVIRAQFADLWGRMTGKMTDLVRFEDVVQLLGARQQIPKGVQSVPLDRIVGSVGRTRDFTNRFLPRPCVNQERWAGICAAFGASEALPPVDLCRIGEGYFIKDGHHRISAARTNGQLEIEAYVVELQSPVWLTVEDFQGNQWITKAKQCGKEEPAMELIQMKLIKREREELYKQLELERRLAKPSVERTNLVVRLLERVGDRLIAFGTQLKANA